MSFINAENIFGQYLTDTGLPEGANNIITDLSSESKEYFVKYSKDVLLYKLQINLVTSNSNAIAAETYGNSAKLTNGLDIYIKDENENITIDFIKYNIKTNASLNDLFVLDSIIPQGSGKAHITGEAKFINSFGLPLLLPKNHKFIILGNDDFTGLEVHTFDLTGRVR